MSDGIRYTDIINYAAICRMWNWLATRDEMAYHALRGPVGYEFIPFSIGKAQEPAK